MLCPSVHQSHIFGDNIYHCNPSSPNPHPPQKPKNTKFMFIILLNTVYNGLLSHFFTLKNPKIRAERKGKGMIDDIF